MGKGVFFVLVTNTCNTFANLLFELERGNTLTVNIVLVLGNGVFGLVS